MKTSPSGPVSVLAGNTKSVQAYDFYVALTHAIMALVARIQRNDPAQLMFDGMDLSHAFETMLYFGGVHDPGLAHLHENPGDARAAKLLKSSAARLLAIDGFAQGAALRSVKRRERIGKVSRAVKRAFVRPECLASIAQGGSMAEVPILFFASSPRFARYFRPVVDRLKGRCAFLASGQNGALQEMLSEWGHPVLCYQPALRTRKNTGSMLAEYGSHLAAYAESLELALLHSRARLLVVPEGNSPEDEVANRVAHKLGWRTACLQQGWSPIVHPGFRNMSYDQFLVWGDGFSELLAPYNPAQRFTVVGSHQLRVGASNERSGVLFFFQAFENWLGGPQSAEAMLRLAERVADADASSPVFIRPHPLVPFRDDVLARLSKRANMKVEGPAQVELADAVAKVRVSVSTYSTTILESAAAGVVPVIFNTTTMPRYWPDVDAAGAGLEIRDIGQAEAAIRRLLVDQAFYESFTASMADFAAHYFRSTGDAALARIETTLLRLSER